MSNVIDFLERMGQDAHLRQGPQDELELALTSAGIASELQVAIRAGDQAKLEALLGQVPLHAVFLPGKEEEDDETEETPSQEPDETFERGRLPTMVTTAA